MSPKRSALDGSNSSDVDRTVRKWARESVKTAQEASDSDYQDHSTLRKDRAKAQKGENPRVSEEKASKPKRRRNTNSQKYLKEQRAEKNKRIRELESENLKLRNDMLKLSEEQGRMQARTRVLQERQLVSKEQDGRYIQEYEVIKQNFNSLSKMISNWTAFRVHNGRIATHLQEDSIPKVLETFHGHCQVQHGAVRTDVNELLLWQNGGPRAIAQTILEHLVVQELLLRPFHFLPNGFDDETGFTERVLDLLQCRMNEDSPDKVLWYARTLRSLYLPHQCPSSLVEPIVNDPFGKERTEKCQKLVDRCLGANYPLLSALLKPSSKDIDTTSRSTLLEIFHAASRLSLQVWIQGAVLCAHWRNSEFFQNGFAHDDPHFEPYKLMRSELTHHSLVHKPVDWLIRPCITFRTYNADGSHSVQLVAMKAQVMIFNQEKCKPEPKELENPKEQRREVYQGGCETQDTAKTELESSKDKSMSEFTCSNGDHETDRGVSMSGQATQDPDSYAETKSDKTNEKVGLLIFPTNVPKPGIARQFDVDEGFTGPSSSCSIPTAASSYRGTSTEDAERVHGGPTLQRLTRSRRSLHPRGLGASSEGERLNTKGGRESDQLRHAEPTEPESTPRDQARTTKEAVEAIEASTTRRSDERDVGPELIDASGGSTPGLEEPDSGTHSEQPVARRGISEQVVRGRFMEAMFPDSGDEVEEHEASGGGA